MCIKAGTMNRKPQRFAAQAGISLVELIMFIIIVSIGVAGILTVFNVTTQKSADPQVRRQMLAIAEALLEEVELKPFTICDPDDPKASIATASSDCTGGPNGINDESKLPLGPEASANDSARANFDNVSDYNGLNLPTASDINGGNAITGYSASVSVVQEKLETGIPLDASLRITVTVNHGSDSLSLSGYRLRYAPRSLP
jgi:MSHA pilin protein MshD